MERNDVEMRRWRGNEKNGEKQEKQEKQEDGVEMEKNGEK